MKSTGSWYHVLSGGNILQCRTKGKLRLKDYRFTNPIAVGDHVFLEPEDITGQALITGIKDRKNLVIRKAARKSKEAQLIACNVDLAVLVATLIQPITSLGFIDRFTVSTESFRIPTAIIFNKIDLLDDSGHQLLREFRDIYDNAGFITLGTSAKTGGGFKTLEGLIKGKVVLIAGHSGVGKSTILNRLDPSIGQKVAGVSTTTGKGLHTTTFAEMFQLDHSTFIIDTPGLREYGLMDIEEYELSDYFPEMRALRGACKFHNCTHVHEPNCAILEAVEKEEISLSRYESYLAILDENPVRR